MDNIIKSSKRHYPWFLYRERTVFEGEGLYSTIKVTRRGNRVNLFTGKGAKRYLQTTVDTNIRPHGAHLDWYLIAPWFSGIFDGYIGSLLILGLGGGSQVKSYNKLYKVSKITAVEIDPLIIELGKKYFDLNDSNLNTVNMDSALYFDSTDEVYDVILLDSFKEDMFEKQCQSSSFLHSAKNHLSSNGVILINKLAEDTSNSATEEELKKIFNTVAIIRIMKTCFFIATNSENAPKNSSDVFNIIRCAVKANKDLLFFRKLKSNMIGF